MDPSEQHNLMACGQAHGLDLGFEGDGHGVSCVRVAMDPKEEHTFMACGQAHGPDFGFEGDGHGVSCVRLQWIQ